MGVTFVTAGSNVANISDQTLELVAPTTVIRNDILIACIINKELNTAISAPDSTWTQLYQANGDCTTAADDHRAAIFWKRATDADAGATFVFTKGSGTVLFMGNISNFRGCYLPDPIDPTAVGATVTAAAADNVSFPDFNPTRDDVHIVYVAFYGNDLTTFGAALSSDTNPDCTVRFDNESSSGNDATIAMATGNNDGQATGARTWASASTTDAGSTGVVFGLVANPKLPENYKSIEVGNGMSASERIR